MSWKIFVKSVQTSDFLLSTRILYDAWINHALEDIALFITSTLSQLDLSPLRTRDHIFHFLGLEPVYLSINLTSSDILKQITPYSMDVDLHDEMINWFLHQVEVDNGLISPQYLEVEDISGTPFSIAIPTILSRRVAEIHGANIFRSKKESGSHARNRFYIGELWNTAYGRKMLLAMGRDPDIPVVGEKVMNDISEALLKLGYDAADMITDVDDEYWLDFIKTQTEKSESVIKDVPELDALQRCRNASLLLESTELEKRILSLSNIKTLDTRICHRKIRDIAENGYFTEQTRALELIATYGFESDEEFLSNLLKVCTPDVKVKVAEALSQLVSNEYARVSSKKGLITSTHTPLSSKKTGFELGVLDDISQSHDVFARIDAVKALTSIHDPIAEQILYRLSADSDVRVRNVVLESLPLMRRELAIEIIQRALSDQNKSIRVIAIQIGKKYWPDQDWPEI